MNKLFNIFTILILNSNFITSQDNEIGFFIGNTNYIGDVGPTTFIDPLHRKNSISGETSVPTHVFGLMYRKNITNRFALKIGINSAKIESNDLWKKSPVYRKERGKSFENTILEYYLGVDFNFFEFETSSNNVEFSPYVSTGFSLVRYNDLHYPIGIFNAQAYGKANTYALPISVGLKIKPNNFLVIGIEVSAKHSFTENLDGSSPRFEDSQLYSQAPFGSNLSQDWFVYSGLTLTYLFGNYECDCTR